MLIDIPGHSHRFEQSDADEDGNLEGSDLLDEGLVEVHIVNGIGYEEIDSQSDLLLHLCEFLFEGLALDRPMDLGSHKEVGFSLEFIACQVVPLPKTSRCTEQSYMIKIEDRFCFRMVSKGRVISLEKEDILKTEGRGIEDFGLEGESVAIPAREVEDRFNAFLLQEDREREGTQSHDGMRQIRHAHRIHTALQAFGLLKDLCKVIPLGRLEINDPDKPS